MQKSMMWQSLGITRNLRRSFPGDVRFLTGLKQMMNLFLKRGQNQLINLGHP